MIRLSILYPVTDGASFDHDYYREKHVPLALEIFGAESAEIDKGLDGPYVAAVHFRFPSADGVAAAFGGERLGELLADMANYTTIAPVMQTSEIVD
jgi:uncharacterized protein (TIGR02118 family)